jgi:hypothetical protein
MARRTRDEERGFVKGRDAGVRLVVARDIDGLEATRGRLPADTPAEVRDAYSEAIAILRDAKVVVDNVVPDPDEPPTARTTSTTVEAAA